MDCNKANELMMDYMDFNLSDEDRFLLEQHLKECESCREEFEIYSSMLEEFSIPEEIEIPENFEMQIMEKIEAITPDYVKQKEEKHTLAYVFLGLSAISIAIFNMIMYNKEAVLESLQNMPIGDKYYQLFESILNFHMSTISIDSIMSLFNSLLPYFVDGMKYTSIFVILVLFIAQAKERILKRAR